ncbi:uncharacterized protein TRIREDRAFT_112604 [Trichoderma reesei QM6a]|uniref:Predicted protein n=1 Tax=Hypocrea jecorina (strain QM6a) TaxID=431241 RepID=G0RXH5_HYPJQ|nr:uncharacterized protein TRIREDRAFT_112604 [Trichoderma reesei QM6a]EGR44118.1 predicted protein [Trichoderma reesei QM6a]
MLYKLRHKALGMLANYKAALRLNAQVYLKAKAVNNKDKAINIVKRRASKANYKAALHLNTQDFITISSRLRHKLRQEFYSLSIIIIFIINLVDSSILSFYLVLTYFRPGLLNYSST